MYDLLEGGPGKALQEHYAEPKATEKKDGSTNFRMIVCGGDGSIGWALSVMDLMNIPIGKSCINIYSALLPLNHF